MKSSPRRNGSSRHPPISVGAAVAGSSLLVGFISSTEDVKYFEGVSRTAGRPPSVILIPKGVDPLPVKGVEQWATKLVLLPDDAQAIADSIRAELVSASRPVASHVNVPPIGAEAPE
jgi:hypothetical protein